MSRVSVIIYSQASAPLERFLFDVSTFPTVPASEALTPFEEQSHELPDEHKPEGDKPPDTRIRVNLVDLEEQFRAIFARLSSCSSSLAPLPENCSFTVCIELKDEVGVDPPIGHPQPWIPAQPSLQPAEKESRRAVGEDGDGSDDKGDSVGTKTRRGSDLGGVRTTPVRTIEAGEFVMEMWIEEGRSKSELQGFNSSGDST